jgi:hypothetical protein
MDSTARTALAQASVQFYLPLPFLELLVSGLLQGACAATDCGYLAQQLFVS